MKKIIIDTDPGVDDAIAILLALAAKDELELLALTTVSGNAGIDKVTQNACRILELAGRADIPVYRGSEKPLIRGRIEGDEFHGDDGLGNIHLAAPAKKEEKESAVDFLIRKAHEEKEHLTLIPIGPLTNIAQAIQRDPKFVDCIEEVVIMGGAEYGGNMSPHAEFNFWSDPEAAKLVFHAKFKKVTMIGLDATGWVFLSPTLRELLYLINSPISRFIHDITRVFANDHWKIEKKLGCELCDVLTVAYLLDPSVVETVDAFVDVETSGLCDGASVVYRTLYYPDKRQNCKVAVKADTRKFFEIFFGYLFPDYKDVAIRNI